MTTPDNNINDNHESCVRYDILNVLYAGMLLTIPFDKIRQFWKINPLPGYAPEDEYLMFTELHQGKNWYSQEYVYSVLNNVEPFLLEAGTNCFEFIGNTFHKINNGLLISPRDWLSWSKPLISTFFLETDIRVLFLKLLNNYASKIFPSLSFNIVKHLTDKALNCTIVMITTLPSSDLNKIPAKLPEYDCEIWTAYRLKGLPGIASMPAFEKHLLLADHRKASMIIPTATYQGDLLYIDGVIVADRRSFKSFCIDKEIDLTNFSLPDTNVWVMRTDVKCPVRDRIVLHKGCAYGAPVYLFGFEYEPFSQRPNNFLDSVIDKVTDPIDDRWTEISDIHTTFLEGLQSKVLFTYEGESETMKINGEYFIKNVPAKILRKMLLAYKDSGRTEFSHSEFIKDESIIDDPKNPNFVIRFQRLKKAFEMNNVGISIQKIDKGKFGLFASCKIEFSE